MIPRTFPSTYASNGQQQMVVYFLTSTTGLQRWADYIPVKLTQGGVENSYNNNGYIDVAVISRPTATQQAWKEYIPVYLDDAATDAWRVNAVGYIPYGYALFNGASMLMDLTNGGNLDPRVTFSRASNATLVNSAGAVAYAPHNLLTFSESFDSVQWVKNNSATIAANAIAAPDGTTTADTFTSGALASSGVYRFPTAASNTLHTFSVYIKNLAIATDIRIGCDSTPTNACVRFNAVTRSITSSEANVVSSSVTDVGNGWDRVSVSFVSTSTTVGLVIYGMTGTVVSFYAWGAQLNVGALQPYNCTTVENALGFTQEFNNAAWTKSNSTITANATAAPDGSLTADKLVEDTATAAHYAQQVQTVVSGTPYSFSIYAKAAERTSFALLMAQSTSPFTTHALVDFNLSTGTVSSITAGTGTITPVGNGWYRCVVTGTATSTGEICRATFATVGNGTSGIFIWGAQLSDSASLDPYVYNPAAAFTSTAYYGPRFDYDPVTLAPRGLLIEEQRTNLLTYSRDLTTNWIVFGASIATSTTLAPDGLAANKLVESVGFAEHGIYQITTTSGSNAYSIYLKENGRRYAVLRRDSGTGSLVVFDLQLGTVTQQSNATGSIQYVGNGWYLCSMVSSSSTGNTVLKGSDVGTGVITGSMYTGDGVSGFFVYGAQLEVGAFATSYIPTTTAAATRAADVATMVGDNFSNWYDQSAGTFVVNGLCGTNTGGNSGVLSAYNKASGTDNRLSLRYGNTIISSGGALQATFAQTPNANQTYAYALAYAVNDFAQTLRTTSTSTLTDNSGSLPIGINELEIGGVEAFAGLENNGWIRRIAYFPRRLSNSELQAVTA